MDTTSGKSQFTWTWTKQWTRPDSYWDRLYSTHAKGGGRDPFIIKVDGSYWITARSEHIPRTADIGPFKLLREAKVAAETMILLKEFPEEWGMG